MKFVYLATFRIDLGKAIPEIDGLLTRINTHLSADGYDEKLICQTPMEMEVLVDRELTESEQYKMKSILEAQMIESLPQQDIRLVSFRRQPGNVSQSVS